MNIYVADSLAFDRIMTFPGKFEDHLLADQLHILNVCFLIDRLEEKRGGTGGNIAYSLHLLQEKPLILACAGKDFAAYAETLQGFGLPLDGIRRVEDCFTASAFITTDQSNNQITGFYPGSMNYPCVYDLSAACSSDIAVIGPTNLDDMRGLPVIYREKGVPFIFDPGQQIPALTGPELFASIEGSFALVSNDYELQMIMKATGKSKAELLQSTRHIITTYGEKGSSISGEVTAEIGTPKVQAIDPTGAGDAFRAGLLKGLAKKLPLPQAMELGANCASFCVECYGTQEHHFTPQEFTSRYEATFNKKLEGVF